MTEISLEDVQPGNLSRAPLEVQICAVKLDLSRIRHAMGRWSAAAEKQYVPGRCSEADGVLAALWKRRTLKMNKLKWLRSWCFAEPAAGESFNGDGVV